MGDAMERSSWTHRVAHVLAVWFGCGHVPRAPGTVGTVGALPLYFLVRPAGAVAIAATALVITAVGIGVSGVVARRRNLKDPQIVVIDEVAGVLWALSVAPPSWPWVLAAVVLFRVFDMTKPWPARWLERRLPGGWGIVLDDVAAGGWAAALLVLARVVLPHLHR